MGAVEHQRRILARFVEASHPARGGQTRNQRLVAHNQPHAVAQRLNRRGGRGKVLELMTPPQRQAQHAVIA